MQTSKRKRKNYKLPVASYGLQAQGGFTLIELMISVAIVAIMSAAVIQVARFSDTNKSLTLATDEFRAAVRTAQSSALSAPSPSDPTKSHVCGFGLKIANAGKYEVFYTYVDNSDFTNDPNACKGTNYRNGSTNYETISEISLPDEMEFQDHIGETLVFGVPYGEAYGDDGVLLDASDDDVIFTIKNTGTNATREVVVSPAGRVD